MTNPAAEFRHVTILYSDDGKLWNDYLLKTFNPSDLRLRIDTLNLDRLNYENPPEILVSLQESYVTMLLMTAGTVEYLEEQYEWLSLMLTKCDPEINSIVAVACHVDIDDISEVCSRGGYNTSKWDITELTMDGSNVTKIVENVLKWVDGNKTRRNRNLQNNRQLFQYSAGFCEVFPRAVQKTGERVAVVFKGNIEGDIRMTLRRTDLSFEIINPFCAVFSVPEIPVGKHTITVLVDDEIKAKCKFKYDHFMPDSLTLLMETCNVSKKEDMDTLLAEKYNQSTCNDPMLMKIEEDCVQQSESKRETKYPTLIHWAAANGLKELCSQMLMSPTVISACDIRNCDNRNAADLAGANDHAELEEYIKNYLDADLYVQACDLFVKTGGNIDDSVYELMLPSQQLTTSVTTLDRSRSKSLQKPVPPVPPRTQRTYSVPSEQVAELRPEFAESILPDAAVGCRCQNELIDLMEDFKKGEFSIGEVEMLFQTWQARNKTGNAISFKEKKHFLENFRKQMSSTKRDRKLADISEKESMNEEAIISISEPIIPRKPQIGPSSKRKAGDPLRGSNRSTESSSSSASYDSGRGSNLSTLSIGQEEEMNSNRKSAVLMYNELRSKLQQEPPPPLPPRRIPTSKPN